MKTSVMLQFPPWAEITCLPLTWQTLIWFLTIIKISIEWINPIKNWHPVDKHINCSPRWVGAHFLWKHIVYLNLLVEWKWQCSFFLGIGEGDQILLHLSCTNLLNIIKSYKFTNDILFQNVNLVSFK